MSNRLKNEPGLNGTGHVPPSTNGPNGDGANATGRDPATGRWAKGNRGGPGNPFARDVAARRKALLEAVTPEDVKRVARKLLARATTDPVDVAAAKVLLAYVVGPPLPAVDPDRLDLNELALLLASPGAAEFFSALRKLDPGALARVARVKQPADAKGIFAQVARELEAGEDSRHFSPEIIRLGEVEDLAADLLDGTE
jgi:hypothetical protein